MHKLCQFSSCISRRQQEQLHDWSRKVLGSEPKSATHLPPCWNADWLHRFQFCLRFINFQSKILIPRPGLIVTHSNTVINRQSFIYIQTAWLLLPFFLTRPALLLSTIWSCPLLLDSLCNSENTKILRLQFIIKPGCTTCTGRE